MSPFLEELSGFPKVTKDQTQVCSVLEPNLSYHPSVKCVYPSCIGKTVNVRETQTGSRKPSVHNSACTLAAGWPRTRDLVTVDLITHVYQRRALGQNHGSHWVPQSPAVLSSPWGRAVPHFPLSYFGLPHRILLVRGKNFCKNFEKQ